MEQLIKDVVPHSKKVLEFLHVLSMFVDMQIMKTKL